jgi:DNA invertase Pin-like site-specific DNA recombinase
LYAQAARNYSFSRTSKNPTTNLENPPEVGDKAASLVVGYVRVSTDIQAQEGVSLDAQRERIRAYCSAHGLKLVSICVDELSGKSLERPGLRQALDLLDRGKAKSLIVVKLDRLTRSVIDLGMLLQQYFNRETTDGERRFGLLSVTEQLDTRNAMGRFTTYILALIAQWEREAISERTRDALRHLKAQGVPMGQAPYGYRYSAAEPGQRRTLIEDPDQQNVIKRILDMVKDGARHEDICNTLTEEKIPAPRGKGWRRGMVWRIARRDNPKPKRAMKPRVHKVIRRDKEAVCERVRELRQEGNSLRAIGEQLITEGLYPPRGERWHAPNVADLLEVQDPKGAAPLAYRLRQEGTPLAEIGRRLAYAGYLSPGSGLWDRKTLSDLIARHARSVQEEAPLLAV